MASTSLAHPAHQPTPEPLAGYELRGLGLFELHREEILAGYQGGGCWLIPSGTDADKLYEVRVGTRPERDRCECTGFARHRHCSHLVSAHRAASLSAVCDCCGERCWWPELTEVAEDHELLSWFPGDLICGGCINAGFWV